MKVRSWLVMYGCFYPGSYGEVEMLVNVGKVEKLNRFIAVT